MTIDWAVYWFMGCGIVLSAILAWKLGKVCGDVIYGFLCAVSVCRWGYAVGRVHGFARPAWRWVPGFFLSEWLNFSISKAGSITQYSHGGTWRGIGNWCVFPKKQEQAA